MKISFLFIFTSLIGHFTFAQSYGIGREFYPDSISKVELSNPKFWDETVDKLTLEIQYNTKNSELYYKLAVAKNFLINSKMTEIIDLLDKAIEIDSTQAKYFAARGIIKYDWGAYSYDYDISEGCPDIRRALEIGLDEKLRNNEAISGILEHPSCN